MHASHRFPPQKVLVPSDMSEASEAALKYAAYLHESFGTEALVLHTHNIELPAYFSSDQIDDIKHQLKQMSSKAEEYIRKHSEPLLGFSSEISVVEGNPADAIIHASQNPALDLVIMGMHGHGGWERFWMGSVTERVIRRSHLPVLAVRKMPSEAPIQRILCPMNPSEAGKQALEYAAQIGKKLKAHLIVLHVMEPGAETLSCPLVEDPIRGSCSIEEVNLKGNAAKSIAEASSELKPDLIVMGAERKSSVMGEFFSSTTSSVMQLAVGPLLVVPKKGTEGKV